MQGGKHTDAVEEFEVYKAHKNNKNLLMNEQIILSSNTLYYTAINVQDKRISNRCR